MARGSTYRIEWRGDAVRDDVVAAVSEALVAFADEHEAAAKNELGPGRGYVTGTLQRSIHAAAPSYDWRGDWPGRRSASTPDLASVAFAPDETGGRLTVASGSGLYYAAILEPRFGFVRRSYDRIAGRLPDLVNDAARRRGLL